MEVLHRWHCARNPLAATINTLNADEILEADESVYVMRHTMNADWPCLLFDVLREDDGDRRSAIPGKQAHSSSLGCRLMPQ
jgi:hypothetical protein